MKQRLTALLLSVLFVLQCTPLACASGDGEAGTDVSFTPSDGGAVLQDVQDSERQEVPGAALDKPVTMIVELEGEPLLETGVSVDELDSEQAAAYRDTLYREQDAVLAALQAAAGLPELEIVFRYTMTLNAIAVEAPREALETARSLEGVARVSEAAEYQRPETAEQAENGTAIPTANGMVGTEAAWARGYDGTGMTVAVVDTGLDLSHPSFEDDLDAAAVSLTRAQVEEKLAQLNAASQCSGLDVDDVYHSCKVPFAFNYADSSTDVSHRKDTQGDHGTHVAGILAAADRTDTDVVGVAPEAQLVIMKVFGRKSDSTSEAVLLAAIEDAVALGVDVINMSLGESAGFAGEAPSLEKALDAAACAGIVVCAAAGNDISSTYANNSGRDLGKAENVDIGVVSMPASLSQVMAIGSVNNAAAYGGGFLVEKADGTQVFVQVNDSAGQFGQPVFSTLAVDGEDTAYEFAAVPGLGSEEDFAKVDVKGKVALVSRGELTFVDKSENAAAAGAAAVVIYNNSDEAVTMDLSGATGGIPCVLISQEDGALLLELAGEKGTGKLTVCAQERAAAAADGGLASAFSSWGVLPDLTLKPELSGVGGNIYSTVDNGKYGTKSGTSMATPQVAGVSLLLLQYLKEEHGLTGQQARQLAQTLLMNTAVPALQTDGVEYSPRKQGAGLVNVERAMTSTAYAEVKGSELPKAELGDDPDRQGVYTFELTVRDLGGGTQSFVTGSSLLTEMEEDGYMLQQARRLDADVGYRCTGGEQRYLYDLDGDGQVDREDASRMRALLSAGKETLEARYFDFNGDGAVDSADAQLLSDAAGGARGTGVELYRTVVTVPAGGAVTVQVQITLTRQEKKALDETFKNGIYVEGFLSLEGENDGAELSVPMLAFYGDWTQAPIFEATSMADIEAADDDTLGNCPYPFQIITGSESYLGMNPVAREEEYIPQRSNALNASGGEGGVVRDIYLDLLRSARSVTVDMVSSSGKVLYSTRSQYVAKSCYVDFEGEMLPAVWRSEVSGFGFKPGDFGLKDGDSFTIRITGETDYEGRYATQELTIPVYIDGEKPVVQSVKTVRGQDGYSLEVTARDNCYVAGVVVLAADKKTVMAAYTADQKTRGGVTTVRADVTDVLQQVGGRFTIGVLDYAQNMALYDVDLFQDGKFSVLPQGELLAYSGDFGVRGWYGLNDGGITPGFVDYIGSVTAADAAGEYIFAMEGALSDRLYAIDTATLEPELVMPLGLESVADQVLDLAYCRQDGYLYALANVDSKYSILKIDLLREQVETAVNLSDELGDKMGQAYALACGKDGQLFVLGGVPGEDGGEEAAVYTVRIQALPAAELKQRLGLPLENSRLAAAADPGTGMVYFTYYARRYGGGISAIGRDSALYAWDSTRSEGVKKLMDMGGVEFCALILTTGGEELEHALEGKAEELVLSHEMKYLLPGGSFALTAEQYRPWYVDGDEYRLSYASGDTRVVRVDAEGMVTAVGVGETYVTVMAAHPAYGKVTARCRVTVEGASPLYALCGYGAGAEWIALSPDTLEQVGGAPDLPLDATAAAYARQAGEDGADVIYALDGGRPDEETEGTLYTLYACDARTGELLASETLTLSWQVPRALLPEQGFSDMAYDPLTGFLVAVGGKCCYVIDPGQAEIYRFYDMSRYTDAEALAAIAYGDGGTGWLLDEDGGLYLLEGYYGAAMACNWVGTLELSGGEPAGGLEYDALQDQLWLLHGTDVYAVDVSGEDPQAVKAGSVEEALSCLFLRRRA